jgi:hypothetical protein
MTNKGDNRVVWQHGRQFGAKTTQASDVRKTLSPASVRMPTR